MLSSWPIINEIIIINDSTVSDDYPEIRKYWKMWKSRESKRLTKSWEICGKSQKHREVVFTSGKTAQLI